jgi:hypothetical protein
MMLAWLAGGAGACAGGPGIDQTRCQFVRQVGMCEATVTLDPRESESPDESTTLEVRWEWLGEEPGDVPDRIVRTHLTWVEARALGDSIDELGKSRCVVEQGVEPERCRGILRIVSVEADP